MATALDVITKALGLTNAVGIDQTLTASEAQLGLDAFNALLEEWSIEGLAVYAQANQTFNTVANQAVYTIGTGGNWATTRPIKNHLISRLSFPSDVAIQSSFMCLVAIRKSLPIPINDTEYSVKQ